ncbi:MAG TPA: glycosyltransferase [Blastocatellia bacterium]|nr:glycosyltransferase [Blastocatellia bacterium]
MICILHGYLLDGSGSNLWTRAVIQSLCRDGEIIHLVCQENHPERFDFIGEAYRYRMDGTVETIFRRQVPYAGRCVMHKPQIGDTLPVYVWDRYEEFSNVAPMIELPDEAINYYLDRNTEVVTQVARAHAVSVMHANHAVLMSVVAQRVSRALSIPFAIMPHGSAIEYAVKKDERFLRLATESFRAASRIFVIGREMRERVNTVFAVVEGINAKMTELKLGVDTGLFEPVRPEGRDKNISKLLESISDLPRGKAREMSDGMLARLHGDVTIDDVRAAIESASSYTGKQPDADLESKFATVDWRGDKILLFVGRLISSKGLQSIIAALPLILDAHPNSRLVAVGHGPLREALEAFVWALGKGDRSLVEKIVEWGSALEGSEAKRFTAVRRYYDALGEGGRLDYYFEKAERHMRSDRVIFTGYLTHRELRHLFPCCDVAIFPSVVAEAGPLVFLESLASGCFPLGTYFAGMAASIDSVAESLPAEDAELMKLSADDSETVADIVCKAQSALSLGDKHKLTLREIAVRDFDWKRVATNLASELRSLI